MVKVWNITEETVGDKRQVSLVTSRDLGVVCSSYSSCLDMKLNSPFLRSGQSFLDRVLSGRPSYPCGGWFESQVAGLGYRGQLWRTQGVRRETRGSRTHFEGEDLWWGRWCRR